MKNHETKDDHVFDVKETTAFLNPARKGIHQEELLRSPSLEYDVIYELEEGSSHCGSSRVRRGS